MPGTADRIRELTDEGMRALAEARTESDLLNVKGRYFGKKGAISEFLKDVTSLSLEDRKRTGQAAGLALGLVEGCLVMSVVFWGLRTFDEPGGKLRSNSRLYGPVLESVPAAFQLVKPFLPGAQEFRELVGQK